MEYLIGVGSTVVVCVIATLIGFDCDRFRQRTLDGTCRSRPPLVKYFRGRALGWVLCREPVVPEPRTKRFHEEAHRW